MRFSPVTHFSDLMAENRPSRLYPLLCSAPPGFFSCKTLAGLSCELGECSFLINRTGTSQSDVFFHPDVAERRRSGFRALTGQKGGQNSAARLPLLFCHAAPRQIHSHVFLFLFFISHTKRVGGKYSVHTDVFLCN